MAGIAKVTEITVAVDDTRLPYFAEALKVRGIEEEPWVLRAFAEKKDLGLNEADIIHGAEKVTPICYARAVGHRTLQGMVLGAVAVPAADWVREGRQSLREILKRGPITIGLGALMGAAAGWVVGKVHNHRISDGVERHFETFKRKTHEMETAWAEALAKQAAEKESKQSSLSR